MTPEPETCWICGKPKGQPPEGCHGHYDEIVVITPDELRDQVLNTTAEERAWQVEEATKLAMEMGLDGAVPPQPVLTVGIVVKCFYCGEILTRPGALEFGPPTSDSTVVEKRHVCCDCWHGTKRVRKDPG